MPGLTPYSLISASGTNATNVKAAAGVVTSIEVFNLNAAIRYLKLYDSATAPTAGAGTPVKRIMIPGATTGAAAVSSGFGGVSFLNGIGFTLTTGIADTDTGSVAANEIIVNFNYG